MRHPDAVYAGRRLTGPGGRPWGVKVSVDGRPLDPGPSRRLLDVSQSGFEWGYRGAGPAQLALAILLDALPGTVPDGAVAAKALSTYRWFLFAVNDWGDHWSITAGEVRDWVARFEASARGGPPPDAVAYARPADEKGGGS